MMGSLSIFILFCKNGKDSAVNTRLVGILIDSFPNILINGLTVTLPLTIISFALALVIALITALVLVPGLAGHRRTGRPPGDPGNRFPEAVTGVCRWKLFEICLKNRNKAFFDK